MSFSKKLFRSPRFKGIAVIGGALFALAMLAAPQQAAAQQENQCILDLIPDLVSAPTPIFDGDVLEKQITLTLAALTGNFTNVEIPGVVQEVTNPVSGLDFPTMPGDITVSGSDCGATTAASAVNTTATKIEITFNNPLILTAAGQSCSVSYNVTVPMGTGFDSVDSENRVSLGTDTPGQTVCNRTEPLTPQNNSESEPSNFVVDICSIDLEKQISIDGGMTFADADTAGTGPTAPFPANALYQLIVTNNSSFELPSVAINDPTLGIVNETVAGPIAPFGGMLTVTDGEIAALDVIDRCTSSGQFTNSSNAEVICRVDPEVTDTAEDPAVLTCVGTPAIEVVKEISIDGGTTFFDANDVGSAPQAQFPSDALYRLTVTNVGNVGLENVIVNDPTLGIVNEVVDLTSVGGTLDPAEFVVLTEVEIPALFVQDRCDNSGEFGNTATAEGDSIDTAETVMDSDPAFLVCIGEPAIDLLKEISIDGGTTFFDANDAGTAPTATFPSDALYRLTVSNIGTAPLENVVINDPTLGIMDFLVDLTPVGGVLDPGEMLVLTDGEITELSVVDRCTVSGTFFNTAQVDGDSTETGDTVTASDPAALNCVGVPAIDIEKQISVDGGSTWNDADDVGSAPSVTFPSGALYRLLVENVGTAPLVNLVINDAELGIMDFMVDLTPVGGVFDPGEMLTLTDGEITELNVLERCDSAGEFTNIAVVGAESEETGEPVNDDDPAVLVCTPPAGCLTRTPGFWGTHPHVITNLGLLPLEVCGVPINSTMAGVDSTAEAMCVNGGEGKKAGASPQYVQLVRQLMAAKLNIAASAESPDGGSCGTFTRENQEVIDLDAFIANCEAMFCDASGKDIAQSGCIEVLDEFNNSEDTLDAFGPFESPGPANPEQCKLANGNGYIIED